MQLSKVKSFCRSASRERLIETRKMLSDGLLSGALAGTNGIKCLECVEREIAKRQLKTLFEEVPPQKEAPG